MEARVNLPNDRALRRPIRGKRWSRFLTLREEAECVQLIAMVGGGMPTLHNEKLSGRMSHAIYMYLAFDYWRWR